MKVGIDGVLLGAWCEIAQAKTILDIGTGTALIALMLAQRSTAKINAIDIDADAILQANENINNSPWQDRVSVTESSLQEYVKTNPPKYDLIVSNPPFFVNSTLTPTHNRTIARHAVTLTHQELTILSKQLMTENGRLCIILPLEEGLKCIEHAQTIGLFCIKQCNVYPKPNSPIKRVLLEFSTIQSKRIIDDITIESNVRHQYSEKFTALARDFYLKL